MEFLLVIIILQLLFETLTGYSAARLAHLVWDQGVAGSNPATPTKEKPDATASGFLLKALHVSAGFLFSEASEACFCKRWKKESREVAKQPQGFFSDTRMLSGRAKAFLLNQPQFRITAGNPLSKNLHVL